MTETENLNNESGTVVDNTDYIEAIQTLKQNSVDRDKYDKLKAENRKLLDSLVNGQQLDQAPVTAKADVDALRKRLFNRDNDLSNLEYCETALELRNALIENGETDPFLPYGKNIVPTDQDVEAANRVAKVMQECIDYAEGNSAIFTNELMRRTVDTSPIRKIK